MRKIVVLIPFLFLGAISLNAQSAKFGLKAGYLQGYGKVEQNGIGVTFDDGGFFAGVLAELELAKLNVQPELLYGNIDDTDYLFLPVMLKKKLAGGLNIQAGPQFTFVLEDAVDDLSRFSLDFGIGVGYDILSKLFLNARYTLQVTNSFTGNGDARVRTNFLNLGLGLYL